MSHSSRGTRYTITLDGPTYGDVDFDLYLYTEDGTNARHPLQSLMMLMRQLSIQQAATGRHRIAVSKFSTYASGHYTIGVIEAPPLIELAIGVPVNGMLSNTETQDEYYVSFVEGTRYTITLDGLRMAISISLCTQRTVQTPWHPLQALILPMR